MHNSANICPQAIGLRYFVLSNPHAAGKGRGLFRSLARPAGSYQLTV